MRRPTRIKNEDYDVPILTIDDFELGLSRKSGPVFHETACSPGIPTSSANSDHVHRKGLLCLCISHVLSAQYSVLNNNLGGMMQKATLQQR
jgi:hypothetical protein